MKFSKIARSYYAFFFLEETKISVKTILKYWGQKKCLKFVRELHRSKERLHTRCPNVVVIVNAYTTHLKTNNYEGTKACAVPLNAVVYCSLILDTKISRNKMSWTKFCKNK